MSVSFSHLASLDSQLRVLARRTSSSNILLDKVWFIRTISGEQMEFIQRIFVRARETLVRNRKAQTMTEYVMIVAAIAVVVYGTYMALGNNISSFANGADSVLTNA
jgi:Flp pilus assembly pilin Flp